jgi:predicted nucleic acid-binding protein
MASYYFDTSAVVKLYVAEAGSVWVERLVSERSENGFAHIVAFAKIGIVEMAAALTRRQRMGDLALAERNQLYASFLRDTENRYVTLPVNDDLLLLAAELTQRHPLRGYDAVHLACAIGLKARLMAAGLTGLTFVSADEVLCSVARTEGLDARNPNDYSG